MKDEETGEVLRRNWHILGYFGCHGAETVREQGWRQANWLKASCR